MVQISLMHRITISLKYGWNPTTPPWKPSLQVRNRNSIRVSEWPSQLQGALLSTAEETFPVNQEGETRGAKSPYSPGQMPLKSSASQELGSHGASPLSSWQIRSGLGNGDTTPARKRDRQVEGRHPELLLRSLCPPQGTQVELGGEGDCLGDQWATQGFWGRGPNCTPCKDQGDSDSPQGESASSPWLRRKDIPSARMDVLRSWEAPAHRRGPTSTTLQGRRHWGLLGAPQESFPSKPEGTSDFPTQHLHRTLRTARTSKTTEEDVNYQSTTERPYPGKPRLHNSPASPPCTGPSAQSPGWPTGSGWSTQPRPQRSLAPETTGSCSGSGWGPEGASVSFWEEVDLPRSVTEPRGRPVLWTRALAPTFKGGTPRLSHLLSSAAPNCHPNLSAWHPGLSRLWLYQPLMSLSPWSCLSRTHCPEAPITCHLILCTPTTLPVSSQPKHMYTTAHIPWSSFSLAFTTSFQYTQRSHSLEIAPVQLHVKKKKKKSEHSLTWCITTKSK